MDDKVREASSYKDLYLIAVEGLERANLEIERLKFLLFTAAEYLDEASRPHGPHSMATHIRRVVSQDQGEDNGPDGPHWP